MGQICRTNRWHYCSNRNFCKFNTGNDNWMLWKLAVNFRTKSALVRIYYW